MHRILDSVEDGGLGLRRCQWRANSLNKRSLASALRLGYVNEGTIRALIVTPEGKLSIHGE
jgi:RimJ/RimL family protein N-acetyltransferase